MALGGKNRGKGVIFLLDGITFLVFVFHNSTDTTPIPWLQRYLLVIADVDEMEP